MYVLYMHIYLLLRLEGRVSLELLLSNGRLDAAFEGSSTAPGGRQSVVVVAKSV